MLVRGRRESIPQRLLAGSLCKMFRARTLWIELTKVLMLWWGKFQKCLTFSPEPMSGFTIQNLSSGVDLQGSHSAEFAFCASLMCFFTVASAPLISTLPWLNCQLRNTLRSYKIMKYSVSSELGQRHRQHLDTFAEAWDVYYRLHKLVQRFWQNENWTISHCSSGRLAATPEVWLAWICNSKIYSGSTLPQFFWSATICPKLQGHSKPKWLAALTFYTCDSSFFALCRNHSKSKSRAVGSVATLEPRKHFLRTLTNWGYWRLDFDCGGLLQFTVLPCSSRNVLEFVALRRRAPSQLVRSRIDSPLKSRTTVKLSGLCEGTLCASDVSQRKISREGALWGPTRILLVQLFAGAAPDFPTVWC